MAASGPPGLATLRAFFPRHMHWPAGCSQVPSWLGRLHTTFLEGRIMSQRALANISCMATAPGNGERWQ